MVDKETKELFKKIQPYLDEGHSYTSAFKEIFGKYPRVGGNQFIMLTKYGESKGYKLKDYHVKKWKECSPKASPQPNKTGLYRVNLIWRKDKPYWVYNCQRKGKKGAFSSFSLTELRQKVESNGFSWKVVDYGRARLSYELSRNFPYKRTNSKNTSGILRVSYNNQSKGWRYTYYINNKQYSFYAVDPQKLKNRVFEKGLDWIVIDEEKAKLNGFE